MADTPNDLIRQAVLKAREGHPQEALEFLLSQTPPASSDLATLYHYTVGQLLLGEGRAREAFAHLDIAAFRDPSKVAISDARNVAQSSIEKEGGLATLNQASSPLEQLTNNPFYLPLEALLAVLAVAIAARCYRKGLTPAKKRQALVSAVVVWGLAATSVIAHYLGSRFSRGRTATTLVLRSGPSEDFLELQKVAAGTEVRVLESRGNWIRVRISPSVTGWVPPSNVLLFNPPSTRAEP
ncbi:MAG: Bacterial domain [Pseudomonadota bacterium]